MEFRLRDPGNGCFEVVSFQPVVVGTFTDRDMAQRVMTFLIEDAIENEAASELSPLPAAPKPTRKSSASPKAEEPKATASVVDWTSDQRATAFARIDAGEKLFAIARSLGVSGFQLRACWASEVKRRRVSEGTAGNTPPAPLPVQSANPDPGAVKIPSAFVVGDPVECSLCGREFRQSGSMTDTCARCTKDIS